MRCTAVRLCGRWLRTRSFLHTRTLVLALLAFLATEVDLVPVANAAASSDVLPVVALDMLPPTAVVATDDIRVVVQVPAVELADLALELPRLAIGVILDG